MLTGLVCRKRTIKIKPLVPFIDNDQQHYDRLVFNVASENLRNEEHVSAAYLELTDPLKSERVGRSKEAINSVPEIQISQCNSEDRIGFQSRTLTLKHALF